MKSTADYRTVMSGLGGSAMPAPMWNPKCTTPGTEGAQQASQDQIEIARVHVRKKRLQSPFGRRQLLDRHARKRRA
jgi:hypothetical protein